MIEAAHNEGEMAGVIVAPRVEPRRLAPWYAQASKAQKLWICSLGFSASADRFWWSSRSGSAGRRSGSLESISKISREYENEADLLGARIRRMQAMTHTILANMFKTSSSKRRRCGGFLSDHPPLPIVMRALIRKLSTCA